MRNISKVAVGFWDYTTLDPKLLAEAAKLKPRDMIKLSRPGFKVKTYDTLESFFLAEALEYVHTWLRATDSEPTGICGPIGPTANLAHLDTDGSVEWFGLEDGLVDPQITSLLEDRLGRLWITTWGGLSCFDGTGFTSHTSASGLPTEGLLCAHQDHRGHLWLGAEGGVVRYDGERYCMVRDPAISGAVMQIVEDAGGTFWLATGGPATPGAAVRYTPASAPPRIRITSITAEREHRSAETVEVAAGRIAVAFRGLSFRTPPGNLTYAHRLHGLDPEWRATPAGVPAVYEGVPEGNYTFEVKAIDRDMNESSPASVRIHAVQDPRVAALTQELSSGDAADGFVGDSRRCAVWLPSLPR